MHDLKCNDIRINGEENEKSKKKKEVGRRRVGLTDMPIIPSLPTSPKVLEILVMGNNRPLELILSLLNKVIEHGMLSLNISSKGCLFLLDGLKGTIQTNEIEG